MDFSRFASIVAVPSFLRYRTFDRGLPRCCSALETTFSMASTVVSSRTMLMLTVPNFTSFFTPKEKHFPVEITSCFPPWRMLIIVSPSMLVVVGSPNSGFTLAGFTRHACQRRLFIIRFLSHCIRGKRSRGTSRKIFRGGGVFWKDVLEMF